MMKPLLLLLASATTINSWSPSKSHPSIRLKRLSMTATTDAPTTRQDSADSASVPAPLLDGADPTDSSMLPKDESFSRNPYKRFLKPLLSSPYSTEKKARLHDEALKTTGGVWRSVFFKPVYGATAHLPQIVRQLTQAEARNQLQNDWPDPVLDVLGRDSLIAVQDISKDSKEGEQYFKAKKVLVDALSTQNVLQRSLPGIYKELNRLEKHWDNVASLETDTTIFSKDVSSVTYNVIINAIFGSESLSEEELDLIRGYTANIGKGLLSIPMDIPVLNKIPFFRRYHRAMEARKGMTSLVEKKIAEKRQQLAECKKKGVAFESKGILDDFILQMDSSSSNDGMSEEKIVKFCVDNTILSVFAGFDTTASVTTNIMLVLHGDKEARELVRNELETFDASSIPKGQLEAMDSLPALKSVMLEAFRMRPAVPNTFRKTVAPVTVGNVIVPANSTVQLSTVYGGMSKQMYGETPEKACPLRFYRGGSDKDAPQPLIFGYGKHLCPGQYLAQIEIALLAKQLLCNYEFELVEGQNLKGSPPMNIPKSGLEMRLTRRLSVK